MATTTVMETTASAEMRDSVRGPRDSEDIDDVIDTELFYLTKDAKHETDKPYELRYDPGGIVPITNITNKSKRVLIHNSRPLQTSQSFQERGFTSARIDCSLTADEFDDETKVEEVYYPAVEKLIWQTFPDAVEIKILEHLVRFP
jgi:hypothetical protein